MTFTSFSWYFADFATICSFFPFVSGIIRFRERPLYLKLLCIVAGASLSCDFLAGYRFQNFIININALFEFPFFLVIFFLILEMKGRRFFILLGIGGLSFGLINLMFIQQAEYNSYTRILTAIIFIALSVVFFYRTMRDLSNEKINAIPAFWIVSGALFYYSGTLLLYSVYDFLAADAKPPYTKLLIYWNFHAAFAIGTQILFGISFWQRNSFIRPATIDGQLS